MLRTASLVFAFTAVAGAVHAQTAPKPDGFRRGSLGVGATAASGNTESITYAVNGDVVRQTWIDKIGGYVQATYGRRNADGVTERTSDLVRAGGLYNRDLDDRWFGFTSLDLERNRIINLNLRGVVAGGLGYHVIRREGLMFDVSSGPAYNREDYTTETRESIEWVFAEESTHALTPTVSFKQKLSYYPNLKEAGEFRAVFDAGLVLKITDRWNATVTLSDRYQSNPLLGIKKNDMLFVTGLQYMFGPK